MGGARGIIRNIVIHNAGDHTHAAGCDQIDDEDGIGDWSDGITFTGPAHLITGNIITNPSDVGIVFFGGRDTVISYNTVNSTNGNHGMFAGIAIHPWIFGDISGVQVIYNQMTNDSDSFCGGIHSGINTSQTLRNTDWQAATEGCNGIQWIPTDRIAHHPSLIGWTDLQIHCER